MEIQGEVKNVSAVSSAGALSPFHIETFIRGIYHRHPMDWRSRLLSALVLMGTRNHLMRFCASSSLSILFHVAGHVRSRATISACRSDKATVTSMCPGRKCTVIRV